MKKGLFALLLCLVGCGDPPAYSHYTGLVADIQGRSSSVYCSTLTLIKRDGATVEFSLNNRWPPAWKGMYGELLLVEDAQCGYRLVSAKELKE